MLELRRLCCSLGLLLAVLPGCGRGASYLSGGGGAGGGDGGAASKFADPVAYCNARAAVECDYVFRCCQLSAQEKAECIATAHDVSCAPGSPEISEPLQAALKGYRRFDEAVGQKCVAAYQNATSCEGYPYPPQACDFDFRPASGTGEGCLVPDDCKNVATESCGGAMCNKTCRPAGHVGQPCPQWGSSLSGCVDSWCDQSSNTCQPRGGVGAPCPSYALNACNSATVCDDPTGKCVALPPAGQSCSTEYYQGCSGDAYCEGLTCAPRLGAGAACDRPNLCQQGLGCLAGTCTVLKPVGQPCRESAECDDMVCDAVTKACSPSPYSAVLGAALGEACSGDSVRCQVGLRCDGAEVNPDGGVGALGTCDAPGVGDACALQPYPLCPSGSFCVVAPDAGLGTCVAASTGAVCRSTVDCLPSDFCEGGTTCVKRRGAGAPCGWDEGCISPLFCVSDPTTGEKTCGPRKPLGAACFPDARDCLGWTTCRGGTCQKWGQLGDSCPGGWGCLEGTCGDAGVCIPRRAEGAGCAVDWECESLRCVDARCVAPCP